MSNSETKLSSKRKSNKNKKEKTAVAIVLTSLAVTGPLAPYSAVKAFAYENEFTNGTNGMPFTGDWQVVNDSTYQWAFTNKDINDNQMSTAEIKFDAGAGGTVALNYAIDSERNYDFGRIYIDGVEVVKTSGQVAWTYYSKAVSSGIHTIKFEYKKDSSSSTVKDAFFIDNLMLPGTVIAPSNMYNADNLSGLQEGDFEYEDNGYFGEVFRTWGGMYEGDLAQTNLYVKSDGGVFSIDYYLNGTDNDVASIYIDDVLVRQDSYSSEDRYGTPVAFHFEKTLTAGYHKVAIEYYKGSLDGEEGIWGSDTGMFVSNVSLAGQVVTKPYQYQQPNYGVRSTGSDGTQQVRFYFPVGTTQVVYNIGEPAWDGRGGADQDNVSSDANGNLIYDFSVTDGGFVNVYGLDASGNRTLTTAYTNYDSTANPAPTISADKTAPTTGNVTVNIDYPTNHPLGDVKSQYYSIDNGATYQLYTAPIVVTNNNTVIKAYSLDYNNNKSAISTYTVSNIDRVAPATPTITPSTTALTNGNVNVTIAYPADASVKEFRINGGAWQTYSSAVSMTANGTVEARGTDSAGNVSTVASLNVANIDKTAPSVSLTPNTTSPAQNVTVTATVNDANGIVTQKWASGSQNASYFASAGTAFSGSFNVNANGTYTVYAKDNAGNETVQTITVSNVDVTPPSQPTFTYNNALTNGNVAVTINFPADASVKEYRINGGTWTTYSTPVSMTANGTIEARGTDSAGNVSTVGSVNLTNIDKSAPSISLTPNTTSPAQNVTVNASVSDPNGIAVTKYASGSQSASYFASAGTTFSGSFNVTTNGTYTVYARDNAGNESVQTITVSNVDVTPPTAPTFTYNNALTNGNVAVTINFPADASTKEYRINGGTWTAYTAPVTMTANGTVEARGTDSAGNVSSVGSVNLTNIDKTAPSVSLTPNTTSPAQNVTVNASTTDANGIAVQKWASGSQSASYFASAGTSFSGSFNVTANGTYTVYVKDNAGNETVQTISIANVDVTPPTTPTLTPSTTALTNGNVSVTINYPADASVKEYRINGGTWTTYSTPVSMTANGTVEARATDSAGNVSAVGSIGISNIDKTAPTVSLSTNTSSPAQNVTVNASVADTNGIATTKYASGSQSASYFASAGTAFNGSFNVNANGTYTVYARDNAGNESVQTITVSNVDVTPPTAPTLSASTSAWTNGNVNVTISYPADASVKEYRVNGGAWTTYSSAVVMSANGTVEARATDSAGNVSAIGSLNVTNVDKVVPTLSLTPSTTAWTNQNVTVNASASDSASGISVQKWASGSQSASYFASAGTTFSGSFAVSSNGVYTVYTRDNAGNETIQTITISNIDKVVAYSNAPYSVSGSLVKTNTLKIRVEGVGDNESGINRVAFPTWTEANGQDDINGSWTTGEIGTNLGNGVWEYTVDTSKHNNEDGLYNIHVYAFDNAGNSTMLGGVTVTVDRVAPANATFSADKTSPTNGNVSLTINYPADASVKEYKIGSGGTWTAYTSPVVISSNNTVYARSTDQAGNVSAESNYSVSNIDKTAPTLNVTPNITSPTQSDIVMTTSASDAGSGISTIKYASGTQTASYFATSGTVVSGNQFTVTANGTYTVYTKDQAGNETVQTVTVSNIDRTAPTQPTFSADKTAPTNTAVTVTLSYPADANQKLYRINGGAWTAYTTPIVMNSNGTIEAKAIDTALNESTNTYSVTNIDTVAPNDASFTPSTTAPTNQNVTVQINYPADGAVREYRVNGGAWTAYSSPVAFSANGTIEARSTDVAGNVSAITNYTVSNIDKVAPINATFSVSTTAPTNGNVTVTINYPADGNVKEYKIGSGGTWTAYTSPVSVSANDTVYARSTDNANNVSAESNVVISNIDKTAPSISLTPNTTSPAQSVTVNTSIADGGSGISVKKYASGSQSASYFASAGTTLSGTSFSVASNGTYTVYAKDNAGNESVQTINVTNVDTIAPTTPTLSADKTAWTNQNVTVTVSYPADASTKEYRVNGGAWTAYTTPVVMTNNGTVEARATDSAGNVSSVGSISVSNISTGATPITLTPSTTAPTNQNVTISVSANPTSGVAKMKYASGTQNASYFATGGTDVTGNAFTVSQSGTYTVYVLDNAGNTSLQTIDVTNIDKDAPVSPTLSASTTAWTNGNVNVTISYPSDASVKEYRVNGGTWQTYSTAVSMTANGTVEARATDNAGNVSAVGSLTVSNIDKANPVVSLTPSTTAPTNQDVTVTASISDASGVAVKKYASGVQSASYFASAGTTMATSSFAVSTNGTYTVYVKDNAGNETVQTINVSNIDTVAPVNATFSASTTAPTNGNVTVTINYPADGVTKEYKIGSAGTWTAYTSPVALSANNTVYARSTDNAGNVSAESNIVVSNIDKTAPTLSLSPSTTSPTNQDVVVTVNTSDASGIAVKEYASGSQTASYFATAGTALSGNTFNVSANGTYTVYVRDTAGNETVQTITVSNIDTIAPVDPTFAPSTTSPTNQDVSVTINYPADATVKQYKIGSAGTWTTYTSAVVLPSNNTLYARAYDVAGNVSNEVSLNVTNIDKMAPNAPTVSADKTAVTNGNVNVSATFPNDSVANEYRKDGGAWTTYSSPVAFTTNGTFEARAKDNAGNYSTVTSYSVTNIDKVAPTTPTLTASTSSPTKGDVTVTVAYPSDANVKEVRVNGGTWQVYSSAVTMTANGTVEARATDLAGNVSTVGSLTISNIDKTPPANATFSVSNTNPTNQDVSVTISYPADGVTKEYKIGSTGTWTAYTGAVVLSANNTVYARSTDAVGNVSAETNVVVSNIDKVAPNTPTLSADVTSPTNGTVNVTVSYPSDASVKEVRVNGGTWQAYSSAIAMTGNGTIEARATDNAGNVSSVGSYSVTNIDTIAPSNPTFVASTTSPTNQDVSVTISYPADATVKQYKIGSTGTWTAYSSAVVLPSNNTIYARAYDQAGNVSSEVNFVVTNIDKVAPNAPTVSADQANPTNGNVNVSATFPSDSVTNEYRVNGGTWTAYTSAVSFTNNGTFEARAKDNAGNYSTVASYSVTNIDKTAPTTPTLSPSTTAPTNGDVSVTIAYPNDASVKEYRVNGGAWTTYSSAVSMTANGTIEARATDNAGNVSTIGSLSISNIDKTAPVTATLSASTTAPTNGNVSVTISYPSDANVKEYKVGSGSWTAYTTPVVLTANDTVYARSTDAVGNMSAESNIVITNIDKVAPTTPTLTPSTTSATNGNVTVTVAYPSDANVKEVRVNGGSWQAYSSAITMTANGTVEARATDLAGNVSAIGSVTVSNIDKTAPVDATFSVNNTNPTNQNVSVTINYPADGVTKEYKIGSTGTWTAYTTPVVLSANNTVYARSTDAVGNVSNESNVVVSNIDKVAPTTPTLSGDVTAVTNGNVNVSVVYPSDAVSKEVRVNGGSWTTYTGAILMTGNGTVEARATDNANNVSAIGSYSVTNIDKVAPVNPTFVASTTAPTNQDVSVTISYPADATVKQYKLGSNGTWTAYTGAVVLPSNNTVYARAYDQAGNVSSEVNFVVSNINKVAPDAPTLAVDKTAPTNGTVTVSASYPTNSVLNEYRKDGGAWTTYSGSVVFSANGTFEARAKDNAGNYSAVASYSVTNIDTVAPNVPTLTPSTSAPTNGDVTVTVAYPSDASVKEVRVNGGTWQAYTSAVVMTANGTVEARATDNAGNVSAVGSYSVTNIDKTAPVNATLVASTTAPTNKDVTVTINYPADANVKEYKIGSNGSWTAYTSPVVLSANNTVYARSADAVGNVSAESNLVVSNIDKVAPNTPTLSADKSTPTNGNVNISVVYPADAVTKEYRVNGGSWTAYTGAIAMTGNGTVEARGTDNAGNVSAVGSYSVTNIDKTAPVDPTFVASTTAPTNQDVSVTISYPADATVKEYKIGSTGTWTAYTSAVVLPTNNTVYARAYDSASNVSNEVAFSVSNIDKVAPTTPTVVADKTTATNGSVTVTATFPSDANVKEYRVNGGTWTAYTAPVVFADNGTFEVRAKDVAGNYSAIGTYNVTNIDKVAPTQPSLSASTTAPTNANVTVTINYPSDASVKEVRVNGGAWTTYTSAVVMTANGTVEARATDDAGNVSSLGSLTLSNIDKTPPSDATIVASTTAPTNQDVSVTIAYPSDASVKEYKIGSGGTWTAYTSPVVVSANNTVYARSTDAVGNVSNETSLVVNNIDKLAPTAPTLSADVTAPTNGNVNVSIAYPSDASVKEVRVNGGSWTAYSTAVLMTGNGTVEARAKDVAGNYSAIGSYSVTNIDKVAPVNATFSADKTSPTNTPVTVTISYPSDANVKEYKIGSTGTWQTYTAPVTVNDNNTVYARSTDAVGNTSTESSYVVNNIDKIAPTTPTMAVSQTAPTNQDVTVTVTFPIDAVSKQVRVNGGTWTDYSAPIVLSANGTVEAKAVDQAGNVSIVSSQTVSNIDKSTPTIVLTPSTTNPTNQDVTVSVNATDSGSGISTVKYASGSQTASYFATSGTVVSGNAFGVSVNGTYTVYTKDVAGNETVQTIAISNIDKVAPNAPSLTASTTAPTNQTVSVTIAYPNDASVKEYRVNGGSWITYTSAVVMSANGKVEARATDNAGNVSAIMSYDVTNIDTVAPTTPTLNADMTAPTNGNVNVTIAYPNDASVKEYRVNGGSWTAYTSAVVMSANGTVEARAKDVAGNYSTVASYTVSNIDKVAPNAPTLVADKTAPTNTDVVVSVTYPSDAVAKEVRINGGSWTTYSSAVTMTANGKVEARAKDEAGNYSSVASYDVTNIDKVPTADPSFTTSTTAPTNQDVSVTISYPADATVKQYKVGSNGTWTNYTTAVVLPANNTVYARAYDNAGNVSNEVNFTVNNIDKVAPNAPTVSADKTAPTNTNVTVSATFPSDAQVKEYRVNGTAWTAYTTPVMFTDNGTFEARAKDNAGNYSTVASYSVTNIDKVAPNAPSLTPSTTAPTNGDVTVTIAYPSDASVKEVRVNGGSWTAYTSAVVMTANGTVEARATDDAGNVSTLGSVTVSNIDKTAPVMATLSADKTTPTNTNVTVSISYPSDASVKEYKVGVNGTWTVYTAPVVVTSNNTVYARSTDAVGNVSAESNLVVSNIDKVAPNTPTFSSSNTNPTNQDVQVTVSYPLDAVSKEVRVNGGSWQAYSSAITMTGNGTVEARATDNAGNVSAVGSYAVTNIDKVAPNAPTLSPSTTAPTNTDVTVSVTYPSDASVKEVKVGVNGTWQTYSAPIVLSANDKVFARATDAVGNVSDVSVVDVTNIDKVAPTNPTVALSTTAPTNQNVTVSVGFSADSVTKQYRIGSTGSWMTYTAPFQVSDNATVYVRAIDNAGNETQVSQVVSNIDKVSPNAPTLVADKTAPTNTNVTVTATFPTDAYVKQVKVGNGQWQNYTAPIVLSANDTVYVKAQDEAGNWSAESSLVVSNIDKVAPVNATFSADKTAPTNTNVTVTISYPSDAVSKEVRVNGGSWQAYTSAVVMSANGTIEARSTDSASNVSSVSSYTVNNIDKINPDAPSLSVDKTSPTNGNVTVSVSYPTDASVKEVRVNGGSWTVYTSAVVMTANGTVEARATDNAGNISAVASYSVTNIDKVAPVSPTLSASQTSPTNQDVTVTVTFPSDASVKEVKVGNGSWTAYTSPIVVSANTTVYARATDNANNVSAESSLTINNIDKVAPTTPTLVADKTAPTNTNVTVSATFPSDAVVKQVKLGNGSWTAYTSPVVVTDNMTVYVKAQDDAGNWSAEASYVVSNIDRIAPNAPVMTVSTTAPTNQNVTVSIAYPQDANVKEYRVGNGQWTAYTTPVVVTDNGTVEARSIDQAGNVSDLSLVSITNIDKVAPEQANMSVNTTAPTNKDVVVTATFPQDAVVKQIKLGSSGVWATYTAPVSVSDNTTVYVKSQDNAGNWSEVSSVGISNIDKVAPTNPTMNANTTSPTNTDVKVSIVYSADSFTKEYKVGETGQWQSYTGDITVSANNTVFARGYDEAGNVTQVVSYEVKNIDKVAPVSPTVTLVGSSNEMTIADTNSDMKSVEYQVNGGEWTVYSGKVTLKDGDYTIKARTTDTAGNTSVIASKTATVYGEQLVVATNAVDKALASETQTDVDSAKTEIGKLPSVAPEKSTLQTKLDSLQQFVTARTAVEVAEQSLTTEKVEVAKPLVNALPSSSRKTDLASRIQAVESYIALRGQATDAVVKAEGSKTQVDVDSARTLVNQLRDTDKAPLSSRLDVVQSYIDYQKLLANAQTAVNTAENTKLQADVDSATALVNQLQDGAIKVSLQNRLYTVQQSINTQSNTPPIPTDLTPEELARLETKAKEAVTYAENLKTQSSLSDAMDLVLSLPDNSTVKADLLSRLQVLQDDQDTKQDVTVTATDLVAQALKTLDPNDYALAKSAVDAMPNSQLRYDLMSQLSVIQYGMDVAKETNMSTLLLKVDNAVKTAELYKRDPYVGKAKIAIDALPDSAPEKAQYQQRLKVLYDTVQQAKYQSDLNNATNKVVYAEKYKTASSITTAFDVVMALPQGSDRDGLLTRLNAITGGVTVEQYTLNKQIELATKYVVQAEKSPSKYRIDFAYKKVNTLADTIPQKADLLARLKAVEVTYNKKLAERYVGYAEKYKSAYYVTKADQYLALLPQDDTKTDLTNRLNVVKQTMLQDQIASATTAVEKAETYSTSTNLFFLESAKDKVNKLPDSTPEKASLLERLSVVEAKLTPTQA